MRSGPTAKLEVQECYPFVSKVGRVLSGEHRRSPFSYRDILVTATSVLSCKQGSVSPEHPRLEVRGQLELSWRLSFTLVQGYYKGTVKRFVRMR